MGGFLWQLITIPFSHYCEKARWALDLSGQPYQEQGYFPGAHLAATALRQRGKSVPVLITPTQCLTDSTDILAFVARQQSNCGPRLFGNDAVMAKQITTLEERFDEHLGPATRLLAYHYLLAAPAQLSKFAGPGFGPLGRVCIGGVMRIIKPLIEKSYRINEPRARTAADHIAAIFRDMEILLDQNKNFLVSGQFSAADLTLAALAYPVLMWPEMIYRRDRGVMTDDPIDHVPSAFAEIVDKFRATAAGQHCRRVYLEFRRPSEKCDLLSS